MTNDPMFSVVIPTYNRANLIGKTLDTVLAQTYTNFEVIVVDNCSTDETADVIERYTATGKVRFIRHAKNFERARSRNTGMENARGDFVTFVDSDDLMYRDNLRDAATFHRSHPHLPCFHNLYELVDTQGRRIHRYRLPSLRDRIRAIAEGNFLSCIGVFISREIYTATRFDTDPEISGSEDWDFWLRILAVHDLGRIERVNSAIVDHPGRTMNSQDLTRLRKRVERVIEKTLTDEVTRSRFALYARFMRASALLFVASVANANGEHHSALRLAREAIGIDRGFLLSYRFARIVQIAIVGLRFGLGRS